MLNRRISKNSFKKVIAGLLIGLALTFGFIYQQHKINSLEEDLYLKNRVEERASDYTITKYDKNSIQTKFNSIQEYKIFESTISVKHSYNFDEEVILGLHRKSTLVGNANVYFQYNVALADANISETNTTITIELDNVYLDRSTVNIVPNTFIRLDDECSKNLLVNYQTGEKVMDYWNQSLLDKSYGYIEDNFNDSCKIKAYAAREVKNLVNTITEKNVVIKFKN